MHAFLVSSFSACFTPKIQMFALQTRKRTENARETMEYSCMAGSCIRSRIAFWMTAGSWIFLTIGTVIRGR